MSRLVGKQKASETPACDREPSGLFQGTLCGSDPMVPILLILFDALRMKSEDISAADLAD